MGDPVTIDREYLELILEFARRGDARRSLRHGLRKVPTCSTHEAAEEGCFSCQAFAAAEEAVGPVV